MKTLNRIARPCGIAGGVWGLLAPLLVLLPITGRAATPPITDGQGKTEMVSMVEAGVAGDALPVLSAIAVMGLLGLLVILVIRTHPYVKAALLWVSAGAMIIVSLISIFSIGLYFLPASVLLLLAAIGIRKREEPQLMESR